MERIDIVIPWVDGNDPAWQNEFRKFTKSKADADAREIRYRDWDNLHYLFRGIEQFAPWVGTVHFITWGHLPKWLNTSHPKLNIVNHTDYIPSEYLPTFSSHTIELNMHRIHGLSERFVYFNDDTFLIKPTAEERFFKHGLPRDIARLSILPNAGVTLMNKRYSKRDVIRKHPAKWFNYRYTASDIMKTVSLLPWQTFYGFKITHIPQPFLRSTFDRLWSEEFDVFDSTCRNKTRSVTTDVNQYVVRYEQLCSGRFIPHGCYDGESFCANEAEIDHICEYITKKKGAMICINDDDTIVSFETMKNRLNEAFDKILPNKSSYEL